MKCTALTSPQEGRNSHSVVMWVSAVLLTCCHGILTHAHSHTHTHTHTHTRTHKHTHLLQLGRVSRCTCLVPHVCALSVWHTCQCASPPLLVPHRWSVCLHCFAVDTPLVFITPANAIPVVVPMSDKCCWPVMWHTLYPSLPYACPIECPGTCSWQAHSLIIPMHKYKWNSYK